MFGSGSNIVHNVRNRTVASLGPWSLVSALRGRQKVRNGELMVVGREVLPLAAKFQIHLCGSCLVAIIKNRGYTR
jgi:hypothetical protein